MRQYVQYADNGVMTWVQKRSRGKQKNHSLCEGCALNKPDSPEQCARVIGLNNFSEATKMVVIVWQCPLFIKKEEQ